MRLKALVCCGLLLAGCAMPQSKLSAPALKDQHRTITLAVSTELATLPSKPLEALIKVAEEASAGTLEIKLEVTDDPLSSLDGGAEMALLSNEVAAMANSDFNAFSSPFYFRDYDHYAMTLGNQSFFKLTEEKNISLLGAKPLAALYMGSYVMVNGRQLKLPSKSERILVSDSFHRVDINWIMLSEQAAGELSELHMAAITEGVAAAVAHNDGYYLDKEQDGLEHVYSMSHQVEPCSYSVFTAYAAESLKSSARYSNLWNWQLYGAVKNLLYT